MKEIALTLPGGQVIDNPPGFNPSFTDLGSILSGLLDVVFMIAVFLTFFWLIWGAFQYIFAGGNKENLGKARSRIIWAIVGLLIVAVSFALAQFIEQILQPKQVSPISLVGTVYAQPVSFEIGEAYDFGDVESLGEGFNRLVIPGFAIATTAVLVYFLIGAFLWLMSGGNKDSVAKAQGMITHAIIGFIILMMIFLIMQLIPEVFGLNFSIF